MSRILLLNPPGRQIYIRDYYCSKVSKSNYLFHPVDLLMLSGVLGDRHELFLIDAIADRLSPETCRHRIDGLAVDAVISLVGAVSLAEDLPFLERLAAGGLPILVSGDACRENPQEWLQEHRFIDAVITDFTSPDLLAYLEGGPGNSVVSRRGGDGATAEEKPAREFALLPRHELFNSPHYRFPFVRQRDFATVLTDYGCPFPCAFCIMATLPYKSRPVPDVIAELGRLKGLGKRELFIIDQTFAVNRERAMELCRQMAAARFGFGWVCFSRVDLIDAPLLAAMKGAGCHTIIFGVESASEDILRRYRKGYTKEQIRQAFRLCRVAGIRTVATFILGLPEETEETAGETIAFLKELDCDFASFNVAVPRMGTTLRQEAIDSGLIDNAFREMDQTGSTIAMPTRHLSREQIQELRKKAVREFYLRPSYLWKRLKGIASFYELREQVYEGVVLLRGVLLGKES